MTEISDREPSTNAGADRPSPRRRPPFNPRLAMLYLLGALVIVLVFAVGLAFFGGSSNDNASQPSGDAASVETLRLGADTSPFTATTLPPSGLLTLDGKVTDLNTFIAGKPTLINMFSRACTACRTEMPALEKVHQASGDSLQLVGVNLGDSQADTKAFVKQTGVTYGIVRDPKLLLVTPLNITAQPMTLWVDAKGRIAGHRYGALNESEMRLLTKDFLGIDLAKS